jgi:hypothetical protein
MNYEFVAIPEAEIPAALEPLFQHIVNTFPLPQLLARLAQKERSVGH